MRFKALLLVLVLISFFSCEKTEEKLIDNPIAEEPVKDDGVEPELTLNGIPDLIEITTAISISIGDDSTVETKVLHNGEEIASSTEKQFDVSISPYGIPVGLAEFMVVSKDAGGNETSKTFSVEIKHLLMTYGLSIQESERNYDEWLFFNDLDGKEIVVVEPIVGIQKIYTDEIIEDDNILFSNLRFLELDLSGTIIKTLTVKTHKVLLGKTREEVTVNDHVDYGNNIEVTLKDAPFVNASPYDATGSNYRAWKFGGDDLETVLTINHDATQPIFIRNHPFDGTTAFDGKKENYRYIKLTPEPGESNVILEANQLLMADDNLKLELPEHDTGSLFFKRDGYEDVSNDNYHTIFESGSGIGYLDLPKFPMFDFYENTLRYAINNIYYTTSGTDATLDVNMPNWTTSAQINDDNIGISANNQEVDFYSIRMDKYDATIKKRMIWDYNVFEEDESLKTVQRLMIPNLIKERIGDSYFETVNELRPIGLSAIDYARFDSYDEVINWLVFNENASDNENREYRKLSYPPSNYSGK